MENLSDDAQQANFMADQDLADTKFGVDGAETSMMKLVDGKLVPIGDTHDDIASEQLLNNMTGSDVERGLQGEAGVKYENSEAALRADDDVDSEFDPLPVPEDPIAEAEITGNPDAGATAEMGLPSQDSPVATSTETDSTPNDRVQASGSDLNKTETFSINLMMPQIDPAPNQPTPENPIPPVPDAPPPVNPVPYTPEIPHIPGTPTAPNPEIQEPNEPGQPQPSGPEHIGFVTYTTSVNSSAPDNDEGMKPHPNSGQSARPYNVDEKDDDSYRSSERPNEAQQMQNPHPPVDESSIMAENMLPGTSNSTQQ